MSAMAFISPRSWVGNKDRERFCHERTRQNNSRDPHTTLLRRYSTMMETKTTFKRVEKADCGAMAACCSFPSSSYASYSDRWLRATTRGDAYACRSVLNVTTSPESTGTSGPSTKASSQPCSSPEDTSDGRLGFEHDDSEEEYPRGISSRDIPDRTDIDCFLPSLSRVLDHLIVLGEEREKSMANSNNNNKPVRSRFHSVTVPSISISDYLLRLSKFFHCSGECFVIALVYLDRAVKESSYSEDTDVDVTVAGHEHTTIFNITRLNVHRLFLTALTLAAKYYDDCYYANKDTL
ncbi:hypothetical protein Pmar_PMAR015483, partial [Perkinsus marinus ATCC 50983]